MSNDSAIKTLRDTLRSLTTDWKPDASHPPNFVRENGLGEEIARVDVWCGTYQNPHHPTVIGWQSRDGQHTRDRMVIVADFPEVNAAIKYAKMQADATLVAAGRDIDEPVSTQLEPKAVQHERAFEALAEEFKLAVLSDGDEQGKYEDLGQMALDKGYPGLAHAVEPELYQAPWED